MTWVLSLVGAVLGFQLASASSGLLGLVLGGALGLILAKIVAIGRRMEKLEDLNRAAQMHPSAPMPPPMPARPPPRAAEQSPPTPAESVPAAAEPVATQRPWPPTPASAARAPEQVARRLDVAFRFIRQWLTTGNVPVKVGVIVSFFGVAFLLKYAVDHRLFSFPIELRLLSTAAVAALLLVIGWRMRERARVYALSLQGGGLGILYLTIFAAFRLYDLIPSAFAFALLVALTIGGGTLAVLQNARGLATLGAVGGFLAPVLVSTEAGNHVVLFSYYLVLNSLILGVAWYRPWRELNLIGFAFTFVIGGIWAWQRYEPEMYASTQTFVILFFLFYQAVAILFARRQAPPMRGIVDGTLVFATPVLVFGMQAVMLRHSEFGLAYSALAAAIFYAVTATLLNRSRSSGSRLLIEAFLALAVAFATLAIPLALDARWTAASWALEGAALAWIGRRQDRLLARAAGILLIVAAGLAFMNHGWRSFEGPAVLNGNLLGGLLISVSAFFAGRMLERASGTWAEQETWVGRSLVAFGVVWWIATGVREIGERFAPDFDLASMTIYLPLSALLLTLIARRIDWPSGNGASFASLPLLILMLAACVLSDGHPFTEYGWIAWPVAVAVQYWLLRQHAGQFPELSKYAHAVTAVLVALIAVAEVYWQIDRRIAGSVWPGAVAAFVPGLFLLAIFWLRARGAWPVAEFPQAYAQGAGIALLALQWLIVVHLNVDTSGNPAPLPYLPIVNPVDLTTAFGLLCSWHWLRQTGDTSGRALPWLGAVAFVASTLALLRAVHQLGGVPWQMEAMLESVLVQAALSVYWGILAFIGMVIGARRLHRSLWMTGAGLMGIVVAKLFLVELGNTGTVARIVSFIAIGGLLLVVGYLAPAPPRQANTADA
jgi:uncharacterized membrane protein